MGYTKVLRDPLGFPEWEKKGLPVTRTMAGTAGLAEMPQAPGPLYGWAMLWTLLGIFAGGMALNLTPCVYPLIPITVSYFGGRSEGGQGRLVINGLCYLAGLAVTNSVLGVVAALTGGLMGAMLQNPLVLGLVAAVLVFFASSLFGFWELRLPQGLTRMAAKSYSGYLGSIFMGLTLGLVAAPCLGPFVLGLLTWVASMGSPWLGFIIFFTLSLGLGTPLFVLALFSGRIEQLPRSGEWMLWVKKLMGWILTGMAVFFIRPLLPDVMEVILLVGVSLAAGLHLGWFDRTATSSRVFSWFKTASGMTGLAFATFLLGSWIMLGPGVTWQPYSEHSITEAQKASKPVIIDFYATWCTPCRELEIITFHNPEVVKEAEGFVMIKVDVTHKGNPLHEHLLDQYRVKGVPTVVFLDEQGREHPDLRLVDYLPPEQFLLRMARIKKKYFLPRRKLCS